MKVVERRMHGMAILGIEQGGQCEQGWFLGEQHGAVGTCRGGGHDGERIPM